MDQGTQQSRTPIAIAIALAIGLVVALAAILDLGPCADDELSIEEFLAQGDEVCRQAHSEFRSIQETPPRTPSDAAEQLEALIEVAEEERDAISDLAEPAELSDPIDRYLDARAEGVDLLRDGLEAAEDADAEAYEQLQAELARSQLDPRFEIAREIGFEVCSKPLVSRRELRRQAEPPAPSDPDAPPQVDNPPA